MATNRPDVIDDAILRTGRVDKATYIPLPDVNTPTVLLKLLLKNRPVEPLIDLDTITISLLSYTSSYIKYIINETAKLAMQHDSNINQEKLSVDYEKIKKFETFSKLQRF